MESWKSVRKAFRTERVPMSNLWIKWQRWEGVLIMGIGLRIGHWTATEFLGKLYFDTGNIIGCLNVDGNDKIEGGGD